ncbi:MAG: orotidine 5'-phosphate decarboxylase, partial [Selenomonadaceae bacterium]|nr:orotidine 5'-phosphate decarboxylase [Selenomonadaceae bacterium]
MYDDRLILALDVHAMEDVKSLVETLGDSVTHYKVGMELFYSVDAPVGTTIKVSYVGFKPQSLKG